MCRVISDLSEEDIAIIIKAFKNNSQLHNAGHLVSGNNRLVKFLNSVSGKTYEIFYKDIRLVGTIK